MLSLSAVTLVDLGYTQLETGRRRVYPMHWDASYNLKESMEYRINATCMALSQLKKDDKLLLTTATMLNQILQPQ